MNPPIYLLKPHTHPYRIELKYLNLFKVYHYLTDLGGLPLGVGGVGSCGCGVGRLTDLKSSNRIEISWFIQVLLRFNWFGGVPPWRWVGADVGVGVSTNFKPSNRIKISQLVLLTFGQFQGFPPWGWGWVDVVGVCQGVCVGGHLCTHTCACTRTCVWHLRDSPGFP